jgi:hypothetical protein
MDGASLRLAEGSVQGRRSLERRPQLAMLGADHEHETLRGTYLAANVIYAVLFGKNPEGSAYRPAGISADEAAFR